MALLRDVRPRPRYLVQGETHPHVVARDGERYRSGLATTVTRLGLDDVVALDGRYLDTASLQRVVRSADIVRFLRTVGFTNVKNVKGGVLAWAREVDRSLPTY